MALRAALDARFTDCGLTLHPDKTKIVYCKDESRRDTHPILKFDFLGYTFRPRLVSKRAGGMGVSFSPAASSLSAAERGYLERQARRHRVARSMAERCRIILRCAQGMPSKTVAAELGVHEHTVGVVART